MVYACVWCAVCRFEVYKFTTGMFVCASFPGSSHCDRKKNTVHPYFRAFFLFFAAAAFFFFFFVLPPPSRAAA